MDAGLHPPREERASVAVALVVALGVAIWLGTGYRYVDFPSLDRVAIGASDEDPAPLDEDALRRELKSLTRQIGEMAPRGAYVAVDRGNNRLYLRRGGEVLLDATVSTGSGTVLQESGGEGRTWTFDTPAGRFRVLSKRPGPVWTKPDWAFLELGQPPPARLSDRRERGVLGEYAIDLGDGYMLHGTLYERLLGRSVTHGCVRVGRDDLRVLYRAVNPGTPVFIF